MTETRLSLIGTEEKQQVAKGRGFFYNFFLLLEKVVNQSYEPFLVMFNHGLRC